VASVAALEVETEATGATGAEARSRSAYWF